MNLNLFPPPQNRRILPDTLRITEEYHYHADISHMNNLRPSTANPVPNGKIEIIVPYDELRYFDIESNLLQEMINVCHYERTDLDARLLPWGIKNNLFPLQSILQHSLRLCPQQIGHRQDSCLVTLEYQPQRLLEDPLSIDIKVYDQLEVADREEVLKERERYSQRNSNHSSYDIAREIARQIIELIGFDNYLTFEFHIKLSLPNNVQMLKGKYPRIRRIALKWPVTTSQRQVRLLCKNNPNPKTVTYNPESGRLIFGDIKIKPNDEDEDRRWNYRSPQLRFQINEPVELYNSNFDGTQAIDGHLEIEVPALLSGMTFTKSKQPDIHSNALKIRMCSLIYVNFKLFVMQLFQRRYFSPYQHLQFPNVELNEMRLADIVLLLQDLRFRPTTESFERDEDWLKRDLENNHYQWLIKGERIEGARTLKLWIVTEGTSSGTKREKEIPGKEKYTTSFATGNMRLYIRGQIEEDQHRIIQVIGQIHTKLKDRFQHVIVIE